MKVRIAFIAIATGLSVATAGCERVVSSPGLTPPQIHSSPSYINGIVCTGEVSSKAQANLATMSSMPAGSAIEANPDFSILAEILSAGVMTESLNRISAITIFAPTNQAFRRMNEREIADLKANPEVAMRFLTEHIVTWRIPLDELVGSHPSLARKNLIIRTQGNKMLIDSSSTIICSGAETANGYLYVIDHPLGVAR